jgi:hypothetical protein
LIKNAIGQRNGIFVRGAGHDDAPDEGDQLGPGGGSVPTGGLEQAAGDECGLLNCAWWPLVDFDTHDDPSHAVRR